MWCSMDTGDKYINMERERDIRQFYHKLGRQRDLTGREASLKLMECHQQQTGISSCAHNVTPSATIRKAIQRDGVKNFCPKLEKEHSSQRTQKVLRP